MVIVVDVAVDVVAMFCRFTVEVSAIRCLHFCSRPTQHSAHSVILYDVFQYSVRCIDSGSGCNTESVYIHL